MIKYEDLKDKEIDYKNIDETIETIFKKNIKDKSCVGVFFPISKKQFTILIQDVDYLKNNYKEVGYEIQVICIGLLNDSYRICFHEDTIKHE